MIGIGLRRDQDQAVTEPIGARGPRRLVIVSELPNGSAIGILEFDWFAAVAERGAVRENVRDRITCSMRGSESGEVAHDQHTGTRCQRSDALLAKLNSTPTVKRTSVRSTVTELLRFNSSMNSASPSPDG